ncbi:hypothetical protein [Actinoplanes sp. NPDC049599]|uniref:hypothetical protein n=1 Tax=Actinoplanes sp. NPDC049599 TaxID=3363903 RepID=UPI0037972315
MHLVDDDQAARLATIAAQLVGRVRSTDPDANARWLAEQLPDPADWWRLTFVLAAAVPDDRTWRELTEWTVAPLGPPRETPPACGYRGSSDAGARNHRLHGEPVCQHCGEAERVYNRRRKARYRARQQAA